MFLVSNIFKKVLGSRNERLVKKSRKHIAKINALEKAYSQLSDEDLRHKTQEFKARIEKGETLDDLLAEAFAVVREASKRTLGLRHFDVQLIGGMVLHSGKIAEMVTGEGKTLVATLPAYLNALAGKGVHVVTVNDYLAKRDAEWMSPIFNFLGLTVGINLSQMEPDKKREAYAADITYGTNNEFGFDYLRDNMAFTVQDRVQRGLPFAIIDEVDSILIDEARTPLIISGPAEDKAALYAKINKLIPNLTERKEETGPGDYFLEEKHKQAYLTEDGHQHIEELMVKNSILNAEESLYDAKNIGLMHHVNSALRAHKLYQRDVDYIVQDGEVVIVDEHTGRTMPGRRWSEGLHQAVEAKENVKVHEENQTLASITFQNLFRLYDKLSGMTGTADTEAYELHQIYGLEVVVIPTNLPLIRKDHADKVYMNQAAKFKAVIKEVQEEILKGRPILLGTASVDVSEYLSGLLKKDGIKHNVLNAKQHEREAHVIAQAGRPGTVTIATNMAGRGTDIVLGGNVEAEIAALDNPTEEQIQKLREEWKDRHDRIIQSGGLHVLASERHESRRIDNQLRGRSGRQGDPGSSRFYVSLDDNLMRIFAGDRVKGLMKRLGMKDEDAIEHNWISKSIENAQRKVETFHFDIRKQLLEFDNVANDQRKVIYQNRSALMEMNDISDVVKQYRIDVVDRTINEYIPPESMEEMWDVTGLQNKLESEFGLKLPLAEIIEKDHAVDNEKIKENIAQKLEDKFNEKEKIVGQEVMRDFEKSIMLQVLDQHWKEQLANMDHLRHSIHLQGYAQKDPKKEYKRESFYLFEKMLNAIKDSVVQILSSVQVQTPEEIAAAQEAERQRQLTQSKKMNFSHNDFNPANAAANDMASTNDEDKSITFRREGEKIGRNADCPCGSGKKYKQCCGKL